MARNQTRQHHNAELTEISVSLVEDGILPLDGLGELYAEVVTVEWVAYIELRIRLVSSVSSSGVVLY